VTALRGTVVGHADHHGGLDGRQQPDGADGVVGAGIGQFRGEGVGDFPPPIAVLNNRAGSVVGGDAGDAHGVAFHRCNGTLPGQSWWPSRCTRIRLVCAVLLDEEPATMTTMSPIS